MALEPIKDIQTLSRLAYLLRQYEALLQQNLEIQRELTYLIERQVAKPPAKVERALITEREIPAEVKPITPTTVAEILKPIALVKPNYIRQYDLVTHSEPNTPLPFQLEGTPIWIIFNNTDLTYDVQLSFDDRRHWFTLPKDSALNFSPWSLPEGFKNFWYKSELGRSIKVELLSGEV